MAGACCTSGLDSLATSRSLVHLLEPSLSDPLLHQVSAIYTGVGVLRMGLDAE